MPRVAHDKAGSVAKGTGSCLVLLCAVLIATSCTGGAKVGMPYSDDFSGDCKWAEAEDDLAEATCTDDAYRLRLKKPGQQGSALFLAEPVDSLRVEADVRVLNEPSADAEQFTTFAVGCFMGDETNEDGGPAGPGYIFGVTREGGYAILRDSGGQQDRQLLDAGEAGSLELGADDVTITGDCLRRTNDVLLVLHVNGQRVEVVDDRRQESFRWINLVAATNAAAAEVEFDNVKARPITASAVEASREQEQLVPARSFRVVYRDDFSRKRPTWPVERRGGYEASYTHEAYQISFKKPFNGVDFGREVRVSEELRIEVDISSPTAKPGTEYEVGVSCGSDEMDPYMFVISPDSRFAAIRRERMNATDEGLAGQFPEDVVKKPPATNKLQAVCNATNGRPTVFELWVNGQRVATAEDADGPSSFDSFTLYAANGRRLAVAGFDNLIVSSSD
jgi:hypothetical protein